MLQKLDDTRSSLEGRSTIPVDVLDMVVLRHCQAKAAFQPAALQDSTTVGSRHALAKAMDARPPADFGLVSTFRHNYPCFKLG